jgi:hypothetical protein
LARLREFLAAVAGAGRSIEVADREIARRLDAQSA